MSHGSPKAMQGTELHSQRGGGHGQRWKYPLPAMRRLGWWGRDPGGQGEGVSWCGAGRARGEATGGRRALCWPLQARWESPSSVWGQSQEWAGGAPTPWQHGGSSWSGLHGETTLEAESGRKGAGRPRRAAAAPGRDGLETLSARRAPDVGHSDGLGAVSQPQSGFLCHGRLAPAHGPPPAALPGLSLPLSLDNR